MDGCQKKLASSEECSNDCRGMDGKECQNQELRQFKFNLTSTPNQFVEISDAGDKGFGLRAKKRIPKGTFLVEYVGERINKEEKERRLTKDAIGKVYILEVEDVVIDAKEVDSYGKYMNHSCDPNCIAEKWTVDGKPRVKIVMSEEIRRGEELTWDYQWSHDVDRPRTVCKCGAKNCRGYLEK